MQCSRALVQHVSLQEKYPFVHRETEAALQGPMQTRHTPRARVRSPTLVHKESSTSYLSSERITQLQHSGVINLGMVIVLATNSRLILENIIKYGLRANPLRWLHRAIGTSSSSNRYTLLGFLALGVCILLAYANELLAVKLLRCGNRHMLHGMPFDTCKGFTACSSRAHPVVAACLSQPQSHFSIGFLR